MRISEDTFQLRELNIFNCSISVQGLAAIIQTNHSLRELKRGVPLCDALGYQALINEATWTMQKKLKLEVFQVDKNYSSYYMSHISNEGI